MMIAAARPNLWMPPRLWAPARKRLIPSPSEFLDRFIKPVTKGGKPFRPSGGHKPANDSAGTVCCASVGGPCLCIDSFGCGFCPGDTPTQFHITFAALTLCTGCVSCPATGLSMKIDAGSTINGTYLLSRNGSCAWTAFSDVVLASAHEYASLDCTGANSGFGFAIQLVRINATQFLVQITDSSNTILLFNATVTFATCCVSFTVANGLTSCACSGVGPTIYALASGGTATVTPC
jgi:hypothetical protein